MYKPKSKAANLNRDQALSEIRVHAPRRRGLVTQVAYDVEVGQVIVKGRNPCRDAVARLRALREALAHAEATEQGG